MHNQYAESNKYKRSYHIVLAMLTGLLSVNSAFGAGLVANLSDQDGNVIDDAVVYIQSVNGIIPEFEIVNAIVDQIDKVYEPHVQIITSGSSVSFPNSDDIRHHVYSFSDAKTFELPLYIGTPANPVAFDTPGVVDLGCNIHDFMRAYILVIDSPYFGKSVDGNAELKNFPAGVVQLAIWHPRMLDAELVTRELEISDSEITEIEVTLELRGESLTGRAPKRRKNRY